MKKTRILFGLLAGGLLAGATVWAATSGDGDQSMASNRTAVPSCSDLRAAMIDGSGIDQNTLAALTWVVVDDPEFAPSARATEEARAAAAEAASLLTTAWQEFYASIEMFEIRPAGGETLALVDGPTVGNVMSSRSQTVVIGVAERGRNGEPILARLVLNGSDGRDLGFCPEHRRAVGEVLDSASADRGEPSTAEGIAAELNALILDPALSADPTTEPTMPPGPRWSDLPPGERSFIDHRASLDAEPKSAARLTSSLVTFSLSGDGASLRGTVCFRTPSAWAGCFDPVVLSSAAFNGYPINTFAGEPVDILLLPETAAFNSPSAYLASFDPAGQPGETVDVVIRGSFDYVAAAASRIGTDEAQRGAPVLSVEVTP